MCNLEAVCWKALPHSTPKWFMNKMAPGDAVSKPMPRVKGSERDRTTSKMVIRREFRAEKRSYGKDRQEHYAKTA